MTTHSADDTSRAAHGNRCASILIVDDDREIRESLSDLLEDEGYSVTTAVNGQDAIDQLHRVRHPCLVLLDLMMPVMDGHEFLRALRADDRLAPIPVVIVSAWENDASATKAPVQGIVKKPPDPDLLLLLVERFCGSA